MGQVGRPAYGPELVSPARAHFGSASLKNLIFRPGLARFAHFTLSGFPLTFFKKSVVPDLTIMERTNISQLKSFVDAA